MHRNWRLWSIIIVAVSIAVLTGCGSGGSDTEEVKEPLTGLANPASVYCQGLGFKEETRENELGQYGVCIFPDGSECDTWDFLAGRCGQEHSYCVKQGFEFKGTAEKNIGTCVFSDGSTCSELEYYQGTCSPGEPYP